MDYFLNPVITPNGHKRVLSQRGRVKKNNLLGKAVTFLSARYAQQPQNPKPQSPATPKDINECAGKKYFGGLV